MEPTTVPPSTSLIRLPDPSFACQGAKVSKKVLGEEMKKAIEPFRIKMSSKFRHQKDWSKNRILWSSTMVEQKKRDVWAKSLGGLLPLPLGCTVVTT